MLAGCGFVSFRSSGATPDRQVRRPRLRSGLPTDARDIRHEVERWSNPQI
jgi:hypothetical protein